MSERNRTGRGLDWLSKRLNLTEIFSLLTSYGLFHAELDSRKPLREALAEAADKPAPSYARWPRVLGLMVVVLIGLELLTGSLLALYYLPTPEAAHASLGTILRDVTTGGLVRQIHFWGSRFCWRCCWCVWCASSSRVSTGRRANWSGCSPLCCCWSASIST